VISKYYSFDQIEKNEMVGHVAHMGARGDVIRFWCGCRWEGNIKMDLQEIGCGGTEWIDLAQDSYRWREIVNTVTNLLVP